MSEEMHDLQGLRSGTGALDAAEFAEAAYDAALSAAEMFAGPEPPPRADAFHSGSAVTYECPESENIRTSLSLSPRTSSSAAEQDFIYCSLLSPRRQFPSPRSYTPAGVLMPAPPNSNPTASRHMQISKHIWDAMSPQQQKAWVQGNYDPSKDPHFGKPVLIDVQPYAASAANGDQSRLAGPTLNVRKAPHSVSSAQGPCTEVIGHSIPNLQDEDASLSPGPLKAPNILANMDQGVEAEASDGTLEQPISISMPPPPMQKAETAEKHVQLHQAERPSNGVQVSGHFERPAFAGELVDANSAQEAPGNDELRFGRSKSPLPTVLNTSSPRTMSERVNIQVHRKTSSSVLSPALALASPNHSPPRTQRDSMSSPQELMVNRDSPMSTQFRTTLGSPTHTEHHTVFPTQRLSPTSISSIIVPPPNNVNRLRVAPDVERSSSGAMMRSRIKSLEQELKETTEAKDEKIQLLELRLLDLAAEKEAVERACVLNATTASWLESEHETLMLQLTHLETTSQNKIGTLESTLENVSIQVQPAFDSLENKYNDCVREKEELQSDVDNKKNSIEVLEKKLEQQDKTLETLEAKLKQAQEKVSGMETEVDRKSKEAASMRERISDFETKVAVLNGQLVESEKLKREFEEQNESLRSKISQKQTKINDLLTESAALRANLVNFEGIDLNEVQTIQKQNMEMRTKLMNMDEGTKEQTKGEYTKLLSQYENLNKQYSETVKENGNLQRRYNDLKTVCDSLQEQYDTLKKQRFEKSPSQPQGAREPGNLPPAIFAQNVETYQLMEKDDQNPTDSSQLNSYLVDRCREDVMKIKKTMLDKLEFQMVQKECAPAFKQLDTMLSQLKAQVNSAEGTSNGTGSSAQLAIEQAESQVVRAKSLADSLEARLQALEGQDTAELDNSAICLYKDILAQITAIQWNLDQSSLKFKGLNLDWRKMSDVSFLEILVSKKDHQIEDLQQEVKTQKAKIMSMTWEKDDEIQTAIAAAEESHQETVRQLRNQLHRFAVI